MSARQPSHAGSWYTSNGPQLSRQLDGWLNQVPSSIKPIGSESSRNDAVPAPTPNARAIIAPHAGYSYSGPAAAWAYKVADWANAKRVFLLGPSHHHYLPGAATTGFAAYNTPIGSLTVDKELVNALAKEWNLDTMTPDVDEDEHSLEMHLPYIYKMLSLHNSNFQTDPTTVKLIPLMIGNTSPSTERRYGTLLAPYLADPTNLFVISSDFCHWGSRFRYTYYQRPNGSSERNVKSSSQVHPEYPLHESIKDVDFESIDAVESGRHEAFLKQLEETGNTVCGRHPIGVFMAAVEQAEEEGMFDGGGKEGKGRFQFVRYERSSLVERVGDSSVSYCSAFAVL